jgi:hypothetical protein
LDFIWFKVLDVNFLIEPKIKEARDEIFEKVKAEAIKKSMESLRIKAKELIALEKSNIFILCI